MQAEEAQRPLHKNKRSQKHAEWILTWTCCPIIVLPAACVLGSWKSSWEGGEEEQNNIKEEPCGVDRLGKAILLIVCRMHSRLLQAKRLQGLLGWTENYSALSCPCLTWLMGDSHPLGHSQELGSGVSHCRACCWWGFDQTSAFVVERIYLISADSKQRWAVPCHCHRTCLPSLSPNKRRTKANDQPNYVLFPLSRLLWVACIFIITKTERHHAGLILELFPISSSF